MCEYWTSLKGITQGLQIQMGETIEDIEVVTIVMNAHDNENGQPLFQIMTPEPDEDPKEVGANPEGAKQHTIAKDGAAFQTKGGHKGTTQWSGTGGDQWKHSGTTSDWKEHDGGWVEYTKEASKDPSKEYTDNRET